MPWSCFRPKAQLLTSLEPKVGVASAAGTGLVVSGDPVVSVDPVASAKPVVVVKSAPSVCCKPASSGSVCCKPVSCSGCSSPCKKAVETPLISSATPQVQVQQEKSGETVVTPDAVPDQASSTQASS